MTRTPSDNETVLAVTAIVGVVLLEGVALAKGLDGQMFGFAIALVAGLAGFGVRGWADRWGRTKP